MIFTVRCLLACNPEHVRRLGRSLGVNVDGEDADVARAVAKAANKDSLAGVLERAKEERERRREFSSTTVQAQWDSLMGEMIG